MPFNFGSFAGGLSQGLVEGQKLKLQADEAKLKAKMLDHQLKAMEFDQGEKQRKSQEEQQQQIELGRYVDMLSNGKPGQPPAPLEPGSEGPVPEPGFQVPNRPANSQELLGQGLKSVPQEHRYNLIQESMKAGPNADMTEYQRQSLALQQRRLDQPREGGGVEAQTWSRIVKENPGADLATLRKIYNEQIGGTATSRGAGVTQGKLNVERTPEFQQNVTNKAAAKAAGEPIPSAQGEKVLSNAKVADSLATVRKHYDPAFLGPFQGTGIAFEARRRAGASIGQPLSNNEVVFRQELNNLGNIALYDASGAQINEQEQKRIVGVLPKATDEPAVFEAGLRRYEAEVAKLGARRKEQINVPRGEVGTVRSSGPPVGTTKKLGGKTFRKTGPGAQDWDEVR